LKVCINCHSPNLTEIVENDLVRYICKNCGNKASRYFDKGNLKTIKTKNGLKHQVVKAVIKNPKGQILFIERRTYPFGISIPAGHIEKNETPRQALKREVFEETGLRVKHANLILKTLNMKNSCRAGVDLHDWYAYECTVEGTPIENYEISSLCWTNTEKGLANPRTKKIIEAYLKNGK